MWPFRTKQQETVPQPTRQTKPTVYPAECAVETEVGVYFITRTGGKLKAFSPRVVESWGFTLLPGTSTSVSRHKNVGTLGFRSGTLIKNIADGKIYLVSATKKRHVTSPDVFERYGFDERKIILVSQEEVNIHGDGEALT